MWWKSNRIIYAVCIHLRAQHAAPLQYLFMLYFFNIFLHIH